MPLFNPTLAVDGELITVARFNLLANEVQAFLNTTKLNSTNLQPAGVANANLATPRGVTIIRERIDTGRIDGLEGIPLLLRPCHAWPLPPFNALAKHPFPGYSDEYTADLTRFKAPMAMTIIELQATGIGLLGTSGMVCLYVEDGPGVMRPASGPMAVTLGVTRNVGLSISVPVSRKIAWRMSGLADVAHLPVDVAIIAVMALQP